jgi:hypothetical protein
MKPMKKYLAFVAVMALLLTGCGKDVVEESVSQTSSVLQIRTRSGGEAAVSYPVNVYVFQNDECKAVQVIGDADQSLKLTLPEGDYSVYAIGGADTETYTLPTKEDVTKTTPLTLNEGESLTDLMAASSTVTLVDGGSNALTLGLERKVMLVQSITISQVPAAATAVSLSMVPLYQALTVGTSYAAETGTATIALTKQEDGRTWKSTAEQFLLPPSSQPATIAVNITTSDGTKSYSYSSNEELEAGYKINIEGTYTEAVGVELTGTITGATWKGERTISFEFDESGATGSTTEEPTPSEPSSGGNTVTGSIPDVSTLYQGCFVLSVTMIDETSAEVVLVSPNEVKMDKSKSDIIQGDLNLNSYIDQKITESGTDGFSDWRLPTFNELLSLTENIAQANEQFATINATAIRNDYRYLYDNNGAVNVHNLRFSTSANDTDNFSTSDLLRPFVTVTISKE